MLLSEFDFLPIYRADLAGSRTLSFSHGAALYTLNGKNVNVMLEFVINHVANVKVFNFRALMTSAVNTCFCRRPLQNNP